MKLRAPPEIHFSYASVVIIVLESSFITYKLRFSVRKCLAIITKIEFPEVPLNDLKIKHKKTRPKPGFKVHKHCVYVYFFILARKAKLHLECSVNFDLWSTARTCTTIRVRSSSYWVSSTDWQTWNVTWNSV